MKKADLAAAEAGSYYTILGAGGDLKEWKDGYEGLLAEKEIGKPSDWYQATGADLNNYLDLVDDPYQEDLTVLMFPLDGLHAGKLALFKLQMNDRWFDDVCSNNR